MSQSYWNKNNIIHSFFTFINLLIKLDKAINKNKNIATKKKYENQSSKIFYKGQTTTISHMILITITLIYRSSKKYIRIKLQVQ